MNRRRARIPVGTVLTARARCPSRALLPQSVPQSRSESAGPRSACGGELHEFPYGRPGTSIPQSNRAQRRAVPYLIRQCIVHLRHKSALGLGIAQGSRSELGGPQIEIGCP